MYSLLIVDDESYFTDSIADYFQDVSGLVLNVFKAYTGQQALEILSKTRIDIVMTDIRMPGMSGIELCENIAKNWPDCKVIILSGYDTFDYVQKAMRTGAANYVLKTEGDEALLSVVQSAIDKIDEETKERLTIIETQNRLDSALPFLQQEFFLRLLNGYTSKKEDIHKQILELDIGLNPGLGTRIVICRAEGSRDLKQKDWLYKLQDIIIQCVSPNMLLKTAFVGHSSIACFIQPDQCAEPGTDPWDKPDRLLKSALETIQMLCREGLGFTVSFALCGKPVSWEEIPNKNFLLNTLMKRSFGLSKELIVSDQDQTMDYYMHDKPMNGEEGEKCILLVNSLQEYLYTGDYDAFLKCFEQLNASLLLINAHEPMSAVEISLKLLLVFITYINEFSIQNSENSQKLLTSCFLSIAGEPDLRKFSSRLGELAEELFGKRNRVEKEKELKVICHVHQYIEKNLDKDVSLIRISDMLGLNPSYLSRFYKQATGSNLSDYINQVRIVKAQHLLENSNLKIQEISAIVGLSNASYFIKVFKNHKGMSPQEFRDMK